MSTATAPNVSDLIAQQKQAVERAKAQLLTTFEFIPDDKLSWSPSPTAKTPLQIVAHCGGANGAFAAMLRGEGWQLSMDPEEASIQMRAVSDVATREEAVRSVEESAAAVIAALDGVTPDQAGTFIKSAFGPIPFTFCMTFPADHMAGHARQVDYLQTIWGDQQDHGYKGD
jgi:hypothetical protein